MVIMLCYLFYFLAASVSPLQRRWLSTKKDNVNGQIHFAFHVTFMVALLGLVLPLFEPMQFQGNIYYIALLTALCGIFGAGFFISSYVAQKHVEAGVTTIVNNIYTPITILLASVFLSERLTTMQIFGTSLLLVGMVVVSKKHKIGRFKFDKYFMLMILSGLALGILLTAERALQKTTGFTTGTMLSWWAQCGSLGLAVLISKSRSKYSRKDTLITGGLRFAQSLSWVILIFVVGNLSLVSSITTFKVVLIFIAAALFLKERDDIARKTFGSVIALVGLLLM